jgi:hypothetical protein
VGLEAEEIGHWETRRDVDRYLALLTGDEALLRHLWFGTPFEGYRARLVKEWGRPLSLGDSYERGRGHVLDVTSGAVGRKSIRNLPREHRLLATLASDFYRPFRVAALFEALFPDERFLPTTSANRVHQAVRELRGWLEAHAPGITVEAHGSDYRLVVGAGWAVCVPAAAPSFETPDARALRDLKQRFADRPFTTREAAAALAVSGRTALRWLADAVAEGKLERQGKRAAASYRFRTEG